ncbi:E3 ubiquitin-protein ligase TRIM45 [Gastrophryne carolinensis]
MEQDPGSRCPLCRELYSDARLLPCLHTVCLPCLRRLEPLTSPAARPSLRLLLCPVCDCEAPLPARGAAALPPDLPALDEALRERLRAGHRAPCDLCGDGAAERRCLECRLNVCDFCAQAHRRQKRTSGHSLTRLQDLPAGSSLSPAPYCALHPLEELQLFCEACAAPSCRDCAILRHQGHELRAVAEAAVRHREQLRAALGKSEPQLEDLEAALSAVSRAEEELRQRADLLRHEVNAFAEGYARAIEEHRLRLLRDIDAEVRWKEQALKLQKARTNQQLCDLRTAAAFTRGLLERGPDLHVVRTKGLATSRLQELSQGERANAEHVEAVTMRFNPKEEAEPCQGYPVYGAIHRGGVQPEQCQAKGQGLQTGAPGVPTSFTLLCNGDPQERSATQPRVTILHKETGRAVQASIQEQQDGTFQISYTPSEAGQLSIGVFVKGHHIKGSPFNVPVSGVSSRQHRGVYHCCTFCSSGGQKDARCGCGATMPGGFQGCGHGHKGHPGRSHWSCCGSTAMKSECGAPAKDSAPRSVLRTVAL